MMNTTKGMNVNMNDYRLRNYIPLGGPATREPFIGDESDLRVSLGFTPKWYLEKLGIDFSEKWHMDPYYRYESLLKMKSYLNMEFPMVPSFKLEFENDFEKTCATISGVHGAMLISLIYGLDVVYFKDNWPSAHPNKVLSKEKIENLQPFDLLNNPVMIQLLEQMDTIEKKWGQIQGYINYQGVLNNALRIRGNEIFMDMYEEPEFVHHLFTHIAETMINTSKLIQKRQRESGFDVNLLSVSNCTVNMISPEMYEKFILPYDLMISKEYERFGVHTCNWNITPYVNVLKSINKMGYIDMGMSSDMRKVREEFPEARRAVLYSPVELEKKSIIEIERDIKRVYEELAPCDLVLADIENTTPNSRIKEIFNIVSELINTDKK